MDCGGNTVMGKLFILQTLRKNNQTKWKQKCLTLTRSNLKCIYMVHYTVVGSVKRRGISAILTPFMRSCFTAILTCHPGGASEVTSRSFPHSDSAMNARFPVAVWRVPRKATSSRASAALLAC